MNINSLFCLHVRKYLGICNIYIDIFLVITYSKEVILEKSLISIQTD